MSWNFVLLEQLVAGWASQSGELPDVILTNLCDQDSRGRFPPGTFCLRGTGDSSEPGELGQLVNKMRFSAYGFYRDMAAETLDHVLVSKKGVLEYCAKYGVRPPACVAGYLRWLFYRRAKNAAPPLYPSTPEEIADEQKRLESEKAAAEAARLESLKNSANRRRQTTIAAEKKAERYLKEQVNNNNWQPQEVHYMRANELTNERLSKRGFGRAWKANVPDEWRKPGRRPDRVVEP